MKFTTVILGFLGFVASVPAFASPEGAGGFTFSRASWKADVMAAASEAWAHDAETGRRISSLQGIRPENYLKRRRPEPEAARELVRLVEARPEAVIFAFELVLKGAPGSSLSDKERAALETAAITAVARSGHPAAKYLLQEVMLDASRSIGARSTAALGLGEVEPLAALAADASAPVRVRTSAIAGLGQIRTMASLEALIANAKDPALLGAVIAALGSTGSSWALAQDRSEKTEALRRRAAETLVAILASPEGAQKEEAILQALSVVAHPASRTALAQISGDAALNARITRARARLELALSRAR